MFNIITSKTKSKMRRNPSDLKKVHEDLKFKYKSQGLANLVPLKGQSIDAMEKDVSSAGHFFQEEMDKKRGIRRKLKAEKFKEKQQERMKKAPELYFKKKEMEKRNGQGGV